MHRPLALALMLACNNGDKDDGITPIDEGDADADADADTDADADADADSDADADPGDACAALPAPTGATVDVVPGPSTLAQAVAAAAPGTTLLLADGIYPARTTIPLDKAITIRSASGQRDDVVIDGEHVNGAGNLFEVSASDVTIAHVTVTRSYDDLVHVQPQGSAFTGFRLHDVHLLDPGRVALQIEGDGSGNYPDDGAVTCSLLELTEAGRGDIRGSCDTGGVDAYGARGWEVRDNEVMGFWCPFGLSRPSVRFWRGARDTLITRNVVGDAAYGIVLGETQEANGRTYGDDPCGGAVVQSVDGTVTNNIVWAYDDDLLASDSRIHTGIRAESSCNATIVHNSVHAAIAPTTASIEHRYETTTGVIANNLVSFFVRRLDDSELVDDTNVENASVDTWYFPAGGDFHTSPAAEWAVDVGSSANTLPDDVDREERTDGLPDVGADEL